MDGRRFGTELDVPMPGSDTRALLAGLGYTAAAVDRLIQDGVIDAAPIQPFIKDSSS
jgi:crotonobetainyl-CoA:carnitine CoA-transferase CaiB-like acyl-CoA transferase